MRIGPSSFEKLIERYRPADARYYYLIGYNRQRQEVRIPTRGAFRAIDPFQHPTANPGRYYVHYCRDSAAQEPVVRSKAPLAQLFLGDTAQERTGHSSSEYAAFQDTVVRSVPHGATHYYLVPLDGRDEPVPQDHPLQLHSPFQFPPNARCGTWEVKYCQNQFQPIDGTPPRRPVWVELKEPVGVLDDAVQSPPSYEQELENLLSILDRQEDLYRLLQDTKQAADEYGQRLEAIARQQKQASPDYTPVLMTLISTIRDLWLAAQTPSPASPASPATKSSAAGPSAQNLRPAPASPDVKELTAVELELALLRQQRASVEALIAELEKRKNSAEQRGSAPLGGAAKPASR
jgi:hypothetical protein